VAVIAFPSDPIIAEGTISSSVVVGASRDPVDVDMYRVTLDLTGAQNVSVGDVVVTFAQMPSNFSSTAFTSGPGLLDFSFVQRVPVSKP